MVKVSKKELRDATKVIRKNWTLKRRAPKFIKPVKVVVGKGKKKKVVTKYLSAYGDEFNPKYLKFKAKVYRSL